MVPEKFLHYISFEKRFSLHTVIAYQSDLEQFGIFLEKSYQLKDFIAVNHQLIRSWIAYLMEQKISSRSINRKLTTLKTFYKFLLRDGEIKDNPMVKVISPKTTKKLPVFIEKKNMNAMLDNINFGKDFEGLRNRLILEIFYSTGMRLSELMNLKYSQINTYSNTIKVLGKRNKERIIPFTLQLKNLISEYQAEKEKAGFDNDYFFITSKNEKIYEKLIYRIVNQYLSAATTASKKSPHVLRHTFATHMLNNGADLNAIKELLGHSNLSATQVYTHNSFEKLKNIYNQAHPRA